MKRLCEVLAANIQGQVEELSLLEDLLVTGIESCEKQSKHLRIAVDNGWGVAKLFASSTFLDGPVEEKRLKKAVQQFNEQRRSAPAARSTPYARSAGGEGGGGGGSQPLPVKASSRGCFTCGSERHWHKDCPLGKK